MSGLDIALIGSRGYPSTYGGFETFVRQLAPWLVDRGHRVTVYGHGTPGRAWSMASDVDGVEARTTHGVTSHNLSTLTFGATACLDAAGRRPDVALLMNVANGFFLPALKARGIPTAMNVDGIEWERAKWGPGARKVFRSGARATARYADAVVVDSRAIGRYWHDHFGRDGVFIPYGADVVQPSAQAPQALPTRGYVLAVARLVPENNVALFLDAVQHLPRTTAVLVGDIAADTPLRRRVRQAAGSGLVRWLGHVADQSLLTQLWAHCGVYFHGHSAGGTNPALLQAMAAGAPVIAYDTVYNREVLGDRKQLVGAHVGAVAAALANVLVDPPLREDLVRRQRAIVERHYTWDLVNRAYEELMVGLAARSRR